MKLARRTAAPRLVVVASILFAATFSAAAARASGLRLIEPEKTVLFLGDSITMGGTYIAYLDAWLFKNFPDQKFRLINLGLGSETTSGLTEEGHPYPRPCIHDRLDRALAETKPAVTFVCYGMNDGIYHPLSEERFAAYRDGMSRLIEKIKAAGSKVVLMTPPPFDAEARRLAGKAVNPESGPELGYQTPFQNYDDVLEVYGKWVLDQKDAVDLVIDLHTPMEKAIAEKRAVDPGYRSGDGIHPNPEGHYVMATAIIEALGAPGGADLPDYPNLAKDDPFYATLQLVLKRHRLLSSAWLEHVGHSRPRKGPPPPPLDEAQIQAADFEKQIRAGISGKQ